MAINFTVRQLAWLSELFHFTSHILVFALGRLFLPRYFISFQWFYFVWDLLSVMTCSLLFKLPIYAQAICMIQNFQHIAYVINWDTAQWCKDVISWSSMEWEKPAFIMDSYHFIFIWGGTIFDILVHGMLLYYIWKSTEKVKEKVK